VTYEALVRHYYQLERTVLVPCTLRFGMRGQREAIFHAIVLRILAVRTSLSAGITPVGASITHHMRARRFVEECHKTRHHARCTSNRLFLRRRVTQRRKREKVPKTHWGNISTSAGTMVLTEGSPNARHPDGLFAGSSGDHPQQEQSSWIGGTRENLSDDEHLAHRRINRRLELLHRRIEWQRQHLLLSPLATGEITLVKAVLLKGKTADNVKELSASPRRSTARGDGAIHQVKPNVQEIGHTT